MDSSFHNFFPSGGLDIFNDDICLKPSSLLLSEPLGGPPQSPGCAGQGSSLDIHRGSFEHLKDVETLNLMS